MSWALNVVQRFPSYFVKNKIQSDQTRYMWEIIQAFDGTVVQSKHLEVGKPLDFCLYFRSEETTESHGNDVEDEDQMVGYSFCLITNSVDKLLGFGGWWEHKVIFIK